MFTDSAMEFTWKHFKSLPIKISKYTFPTGSSTFAIEKPTDPFISQFLKEKFDKWSRESTKCFKCERGVFYEDWFADFLIGLSGFVLDDFSEIERLYLTLIDFFMKYLYSQILREMICFVLIASDEGDGFQKKKLRRRAGIPDNHHSIHLKDKNKASKKHGFETIKKHDFKTLKK